MRLLSQTTTFMLAGGRGQRLEPLTRDRSKPAVPFGDRHIIDFALANCVRSNLEHPFVITQYQGTQLTSLVGRWWLRQTAAGVDTDAAPICLRAPEREYAGTADALFRNLHLLQQNTEHVLVLSADHIYDMDYRELLRFHADRDADVTLAAVVYPSESSQHFGVLEVDKTGRIAGFEEKPEQPKELPGQPGKALVNMGVYVFRKDVFLAALGRDAANSKSLHDIGRNILPDLVGRMKLYAFRFEDPATRRPRYWKDVGTIDSYYEAAMEWLDMRPRNHLAGPRSVIAEGVRIHPKAAVTDSILMPGVEVGAGAHIRRAILDENVRVLPGARIGHDSGIVVVPANSTVRPEIGLRKLKYDREQRQIPDAFASEIAV